MLFVRRILTFIILLLGLLFAKGQTPTAEELVGIHRLTATEINAIASPIIGTLVYNTTTNIY